LNPFSKLLRRSRTPSTGTTSTRRADTGAQVSDTIDRALTAAGITQHAGPGVDIRATIDRALAQAGLAQPSPTADGTIATPTSHGARKTAAAAPSAGGQWLARSFSNDAGTRSYMLYVPVDHVDKADAPMPLIVMLHGCTQSPDDFAAGTRMNQLADTHGFLVAYPAQPANANGNKCWNWFRAGDQAHGRGEPSLLAGIARHVASDYRVDPRRVFVAGLSAGAAMAVILGETYPEVFAAVGAHSGLPFAAANDVSSAFTAMKAGRAHATASAHVSRVPTIVFHGDADHTVAVGNGDDIVRDATTGMANNAPHTGVAPGGRIYTQTVFTNADGQTRAEYWRVRDAGHAWSGGSAKGSYTDPTGPDASAEMVRFFLQLSATASKTALEDIAV